MFYVKTVYSMNDVDIVDTIDGVSELVSLDLAYKVGNIVGLEYNNVRSVSLEDLIEMQLLTYRTVKKEIPFKIEGTTLVKCIKDVEEVEVPYGITTIGTYAFKICSELRKVVLPLSVHNIEMAAFYRCDNLTDVEIPDSVDSLGKTIVMDWVALQNIKLASKCENAYSILPS